jgi:excinuclease ABC subunit C
MEKIKQKIAMLPESSGVYLMKNSNGKIIYIGKAKVLKYRVRSYFGSNPDAKTKKLVSQIADFDYIITDSEQDALRLEANLIKKYKPKFNIDLKDDKQYPFIRITNEAFPRIFITRNVVQDGSRYYGPYTDVRALKKTMRLLNWIFPIRSCKRVIDENTNYERACVNYQLNKCSAPCVGKISESEYKRMIKRVVSFLKGRNEDIIRELKDEMNQYAERYQFEKAALLRDTIENLQKVSRTKTVFFDDRRDRDVIALYKEESKAAACVLKFLSGKLLNKEIYELKQVEGSSDAELMEAFLQQYYVKKIDDLPFQIIIENLPENYEQINKWLNGRLHNPQRGQMRTLTKMARENAFNYVEEQKLKYLRKSNRTIFPIKELKDKLGLHKLPRKIICCDISTIQGVDTVSALVFFENGKPKKKNYRHFIMKNVVGQNDYASMKEMLNRYFAKADQYELPDLIIIDGGKGQLSAALEVMNKMNMRGDIEVAALAKKKEEIFLPDRKESVILPRNSTALQLVIAIRDEAHRFAITFHRKRRTTRTLTSKLDEINGIGSQTKFMLLKQFGSVENIKNSTIDDLAAIKGIGKKRAETILEKLNR